MIYSQLQYVARNVGGHSAKFMKSSQPGSAARKAVKSPCITVIRHFISILIIDSRAQLPPPQLNTPGTI